MFQRASFTVMLMALLLPLLIGCGTHTQGTTYRYTGKSAHWAATIDVTQRGDGDQEQLTLSWTGGSPQNVGPVAYQLQLDALPGTKISGSDITLTPAGQHQGGFGGRGGLWITNKSTGTLTVAWNGQSETVQLTQTGK